MFVYFIVKTVKTNHASMHNKTCWGICVYSVGMLTTGTCLNRLIVTMIRVICLIISRGSTQEIALATT